MWNELSDSNEEPDNLDVMAEELIDDASTEQDVYNDESQEEVDLNEIHPDGVFFLPVGKLFRTVLWIRFIPIF